MAAVPDLEATLETVAALAANIPAFDRPTEYIALSRTTRTTASTTATIQSVLPDGTKQRYPVADYRLVTNEYVVPQSTAKYTKNKLDSYAVGALARFNNNYDMLHARGQEGRRDARPAADLHQPLHEHRGPGRRDRAQRLRQPAPHRRAARRRGSSTSRSRSRRGTARGVRCGRGAARHPVPRVRRTTTPASARAATASSRPTRTTPTSSTTSRSSCRELLAADKGEKEMELALEMLVRAYDPCISCSTHYLDVTFVR